MFMQSLQSESMQSESIQHNTMENNFMETNPKRSNGRVDILGPNPDLRFSMMDRIPVNQQCGAYSEAMTGNWNNTPLSVAYFSERNIKIIQNGIRAGVYNKSNGQYVIGEQNCDELKIIMRSVFLQHSKNLATDIPGQIKVLNDFVLKQQGRHVPFSDGFKNPGE